MQTIASTLVTALVTMSAAMLMIHAGIAKRSLAWRARGTNRKSAAAALMPGTRRPVRRILRRTGLVRSLGAAIGRRRCRRSTSCAG